MSESASVARGGASTPRHGVRILVIWAVATAIVLPLVIWVVGPHIPPGSMSQQTRDQHQVDVVLTALAVPIVLMVWVYFGYAITVFRQDGAAIVAQGFVAEEERIGREDDAAAPKGALDDDGRVAEGRVRVAVGEDEVETLVAGLVHLG